VPRRFDNVLLLIVVAPLGCLRIADEPIDYEALRTTICEQACTTYDTCDPDRFVGMEPSDCHERCMTLLLVHEENQCGSRELIWLRCVGELNCDQFEEFQQGNDLPAEQRDYSAPCVTEIQWSASCSWDKPFDLDEPVPTHP
jgi:hypothetical protein